MIDYRNDGTETVIAKVIESQNFLKPKKEAKNFLSKKFAKEMNEREKALFTITQQIIDDLLNLADTFENMLERELLGIYFDVFCGEFFKELSKNRIIMFHTIVICSDEKIYYISREEAMDTCKHCPRYEKCKKRLS